MVIMVEMVIMVIMVIIVIMDSNSILPQVSLKTEIIKQKQEMINCLQDELIKVTTI